MEKLRRVLTGQDDEEQGLTTQVPPGGDPFFPLPAPVAWWPPLTAAELRLAGRRPLPRGARRGLSGAVTGGSLEPPCLRPVPVSAASGFLFKLLLHFLIPLNLQKL